MQLSDLHLGARLVSLPGEIAEVLRRTTREITEEAFLLARRQSVDIVLMPGDLFEQQGVDPAGQLHFIYELAAALAPVPVVIAPGNHDPYSAESPYATIAAPANVKLFSSPEFQLLDTAACQVAGRAFLSGQFNQMLDWSRLPPAPQGTSILTLHASLMSGGDGRQRKSVMLPVTTTALEQSGYTYTALGHYHTYQQVARGSGGAFVAYSGCPQGLGWDEAGVRGFLTGELDESGARLEFHETEGHVWQRHELPLPDWHGSQSWDELEARLERIAAQVNEWDLLRVDFRGRWPATEKEELRSRLSRLFSGAWHAEAIDWGATEFTPPLVPRGASKVLDEFLDGCDEAIEGTADDSEAEAWRLARYLGHRLLSGRELPGEIV